MAVKTGAIFNSLIFGGINSADYGIYITGEAVYNAPERAVEMVNVPGRNGAIVIDQGHWDNIRVTYPAGTFGKDQAEFREAVSAFRNAVLSQLGYQRLTDTYHPDEYRMAVYISGLEVDPTHYGSAGEFKLQFDCKPQRWLTEGEQEITVGEWGETETATGETVTIENPNGNLSLKSLNVAIEPVQNLNGYDKPWVGGAGKNKLPYPYDSNSQTISGVTFTVNSDGTIKANGTATAEINFNLLISKSLASVGITSGTYTLNGCPSGGSSSTYRIQIRQNSSWATDNGSGVNFTYNDSSPVNDLVRINILSGATVNNLTFKPMIRLASEADATYEPYSNICPISGRTEVVAQRTGINVWDEEWEVGYIDPTTGREQALTDRIRMKNYVRVLPNTTYYKKSPNSFWNVYFDENKTYIGYGSAGQNMPFTTPSNCHYIRSGFERVYGTTYNHDISINYPSTDTEYHAYDGSTYTTSLGRTVYGGTLDVVSRELTVDRVGVTVSSLTTCSALTNGTYTSLKRFTLNPASVGGSSSQKNGAISSMGVQGTAYYGANRSNEVGSKDVDFAISTGGEVLAIYDDDTTLTDADFMAKYGTMQVVYPLATPQTYQLTAQQIELLIGTNNIWSDGDITAEYGQDPDALYNPTPYDASPLLMVEGYGTIGFNGYEIEIENAVLGEVELARSTGFPLPPIGTMNYENSIPFNDQLLLEGDEFTISFPYMKWTTNLDGWGFDYPLTLQTLVDSNSDATTTLDAGQHIPTLPHPSPGGSWAGNYNYTTVISPIRFEKGTAKTWSDTVTASNSIFKSGTSETENLSFAFDISVIYDGVSPEVKVVRSVSFSDATVIRSNSYHIAHCRHSEITGYSSVSILGDPTYIDCDLGDAYMIKDGSYISLNSYIDLGSDLPVLASGNNELSVDNTITELKIVPRWWIL